MPNILRYHQLVVMILLFPCLLESAYMSGFSPGFNIRNLVKHTDLIVYGTVVKKQFVFRANTTPQYTTAITVNVQQRIKGNPNAGNSKVKFMIKGGEGIHPETGRDLIVKAGSSPRFEVGEQVLLFLKKSKRRELNLPHDGYYVFYGRVGKMQVINNSVLIPYSFRRPIVDNYNGQLINKEINIRRGIKLPIGLVINIGKASLKDYDAVVPMEAKIRSVITNSRRGTIPAITEEMSNELNQTANQILERDED